MLKMFQINYIRDLHNSECRISEITREAGIDPKTIRKYISKDDFSEKPPIKTTHQSILDEHMQTIDAWLEENKKSCYKQKHTAKRVMTVLLKNMAIPEATAWCNDTPKRCASIFCQKPVLSLSGHQILRK